MNEQPQNNQRTTVAEAIAAWEAEGDLYAGRVVTLMAEALYSVREICNQVETNPVGWGGAHVVSLARTLVPVPSDEHE